MKALAKNADDERFAYDSYRRFIQMYSGVVLGVEHHHFEELLESHKDAATAHELDTDLTRRGLARSVAGYKDVVETRDRQAVPAGSAASSCGARSARCSARG